MVVTRRNNRGNSNVRSTPILHKRGRPKLNARKQQMAATQANNVAPAMVIPNQNVLATPNQNPIVATIPTSPPASVAPINTFRYNVPEINPEGNSSNNPSRINGMSLLTTFYDGESPNGKFFFKQFNEIAKMSGWTNNEKVTILKTRLRGNALDFVLNDVELAETEDCNFIIEKLLEFFSEDRELSQNQTNFSTCKQWEGESIKNLAYRVTLLTNNYLGTSNNIKNTETREIVERLKLSKFIDALIPEIKVDVLRTNPQSFKNAVEIATNSQKAIDTLKQLGNMQINALLKKEEMEIKCCFCGEGHYSKQCEVYQTIQNTQNQHHARSITQNNRGNFHNPRRGNFSRQNTNFSQNNNYNSHDQRTNFNRGGRYRNRGNTFRGRYFRNTQTQNSDRNHFLGENPGTLI